MKALNKCYNSQIYFMTNIDGLGRLKDLPREIQRERKIKIDISKTQYPLFRNVAINQLGWKIWGKQDQRGEVNLFWNDTYITEQNIKRLKPYQRVNHFPNSQELGKKNLLSENLRKMKSLLPNDYNFFPETWSMPEQEPQLKEAMQTKKWLIVKPSASSQGKGIYLTKDINSIPKQNSVVQEYITNPHLIDGCKYDLRIYVLVKSLVPLKIFRFQEGLTRMATHAYEMPSKQNKKNMNMHLTNYAINKLNPAYVSNKDIQDDSFGHKRSLASAYKSLSESGCNTEKLRQQIDQVIAKTILSCYPRLLESYKNCRDCQIQAQSVCFEIFGIDILIDQNFKPWLLEVNHSPSFCTESPLDLIIKKFLVLDTFILLNLKCEDKEMFLKNRTKQKSQTNIMKDKDAAKIKRSAETVYENNHLGGFTKIYPTANGLYAQILKKIVCKKMSSKNAHKMSIPVQKQVAIPPEKKTVESSPIKIRNQNPYFTFYGQLQVLKGKRQSYFDEETPKDDEIIRRHVSFERDKKKGIQPMKMKNVSISFLEDMKTQYQNGFQTRSTTNSTHKPAGNSFKGKSLQPQDIPNESKTAEGNRKQIKMLDHEIRSRIGKMKLARIKLRKIRSNDKRDEPNSSRIMRNSQIKEQLRASSKII